MEVGHTVMTFMSKNSLITVKKKSNNFIGHAFWNGLLLYSEVKDLKFLLKINLHQ